ncbi:MAG: hypothetical protein RIC95_05480 [Vicingaceae bacterium]
MKTSKLFLAVILVSLVTLSSCSYRLVDFTVISTKNAEIGVDRSKGKKTMGKKSYFLGLGWNLKDAIDDALGNAGTEYDLLIDGVVTYVSIPLFPTIKVSGLAVSSSDLKADLGEDGFEDWLNQQDNVLWADGRNLEEKE